jgi:hypothetical protein
MPLLGFTVFKEEVRNGIKRQSIRKLRKYPIKVGDKLWMYWHTRQKDCEFLREDLCTQVMTIRFCYDPNFCGGGPVLRVDKVGNEPDEKAYVTRQLRPMEVEDLAIRDGFKNELEMADWFYKTHKELSQLTFQVIRW